MHGERAHAALAYLNIPKLIYYEFILYVSSLYFSNQNEKKDIFG
jgi:hypothetical protein